MSKYGTVFAVKRFAVHDGDGIRTTLFLKGCPLRCLWCHNPEGLSPAPQLAYYAHKCIGCRECATVCENGVHTFNDGHIINRENCISCRKCTEACLAQALELYGKKMSSEEAINILLADRQFYESSGGGITLSGGEPLMQYEFAKEVFMLAKQSGINTALDTCGYAPKEAFAAVLPYVDKVLFDIKAASSALHERLTGKPNGIILENLKYIDSENIPIEIRIPIIPEANGCELEAMAMLCSGFKCIVAVRLLPYHTYIGTKYASLGSKYDEKFTVPTDEYMQNAADIFKMQGNKVILPND